MALFLLRFINAFLNSGIQHHLVMWSVDSETLPQWFEVTTFSHSTQPHMETAGTFVWNQFCSIDDISDKFLHHPWSIGHCMHIFWDCGFSLLKETIILNTFPISKAAGYKVEVLEYHDAEGEFHKVNYTEESGRVRRKVEKEERKKIATDIY